MPLDVVCLSGPGCLNAAGLQGQLGRTIGCNGGVILARRLVGHGLAE